MYFVAVRVTDPDEEHSLETYRISRYRDLGTAAESLAAAVMRYGQYDVLFLTELVFEVEVAVMAKGSQFVDAVVHRAIAKNPDQD